MSEMVERVAQAICAAFDFSEWDEITPYWQECFRDQARAAMASMREPDAPTLSAGAFAEFEGMDTNALNVWHAMIDEALK